VVVNRSGIAKIDRVIAPPLEPFLPFALRPVGYARAYVWPGRYSSQAEQFPTPHDPIPICQAAAFHTRWPGSTAGSRSTPTAGIRIAGWQGLFMKGEYHGSSKDCRWFEYAFSPRR
jgi:hypothetical protein